MSAVPDGTGIRMAAVIAKGLTGKLGLEIIDSFKESQARGDTSVTPSGARTADSETATPGSDFILLEEEVVVHLCIAEGENDPAAIPVVAVAYHARRALLLAGYTNVDFEFSPLAQQQSGERLIYSSTLTVGAQSSAHFGVE